MFVCLLIVYGMSLYFLFVIFEIYLFNFYLIINSFYEYVLFICDVMNFL